MYSIHQGVFAANLPSNMNLALGRLQRERERERKIWLCVTMKLLSFGQFWKEYVFSGPPLASKSIPEEGSCYQILSTLIVFSRTRLYSPYLLTSQRIITICKDIDDHCLPLGDWFFVTWFFFFPSVSLSFCLSLSTLRQRFMRSLEKRLTWV